MKFKIKLFLIIVGLFLLSGMPARCSVHSDALNKIKIIKNKQAQAHAKIRHLRFLENIETNKLYKNQKKLETTKCTLKKSQNDYAVKQQQLVNMENALQRANIEFISIDRELKGRIRQIYKKQKVGFLQLLISSEDVNQAIDRVYYESIVVKDDYRRLNLAQQKARQIVALHRQIEQQKRSIQRTINDISNQKQAIQSNIAQNQDMISKLKTDRSYYERSERELARQSASIQAMIANLNRPGTKRTTTVRVTSGFIKPISGPITSSFGYRIHPIFKSRIFHSGIDIGGPSGGAVCASNNGQVIYAGWCGGYGQVVILDHGVVRGQPITTLYAHLSSISVSKGQKVSKGQQVGREGSTGYSTGPHCHFEVRVNGRPRNPLNYI